MRLLPFLLALPALAGTPDLFIAIRSGDAKAVKAQLRDPALKDAPDSSGRTPLIYAVMTAGLPAMRALLDAGANVNAATPDGLTALHVAAFGLEKTRLLLEKGANPNAASKNGETPLLLAADHTGASPIVALLIAKGANANAKITGGAFSGPTALDRAARNADPALMRLLLANGAKIADTANLARLAAFGHCRECLAIALEGGATANGKPRSRSALQDAAAFADVEMVRSLIAKGADVNAADGRGYTALMRAALSYEPTATQVVELLLASGANPAPKNETGDTALSFALRFGETPVAALLRKAGAPEPKTAVRVPAPLETNTVADAVKRTLPLLQRIGEPVRKLAACTTCHNHTLPAMAVAMARARGFAVNEEIARKETTHAATLDQGLSAATLVANVVPDFFAYQLIGLGAETVPPGDATDRMVHYIAAHQDPAGRFKVADYRPPQEYTDITFTATALRSMQIYPIPGRAAEFKERVQRSARWLAAQKPRDNEDHALRLMGLAWARVSKSTLDAAASALIARQQPDGGWSQLAHIAPDAYATGQTLYALHLAGIPATHPAYRKGVEYLLKTQRKDGSWYVTSRSHPVQPLIDGGHPYINHQWISASAGAWSTMSLLATLPLQTARK